MSLGVMVVVLTLLSLYFLTYENIISIGLQMSVVAIMAVGQIMVIISRGIDLAGPKAIASSFWLTVKAGALKAGEDCNVDILWKGPDAWSPDPLT